MDPSGWMALRSILTVKNASRLVIHKLTMVGWILVVQRGDPPFGHFFGSPKLVYYSGTWSKVVHFGGPGIQNSFTSTFKILPNSMIINDFEDIRSFWDRFWDRFWTSETTYLLYISQNLHYFGGHWRLAESSRVEWVWDRVETGWEFEVSGVGWTDESWVSSWAESVQSHSR